MKQKENQNILYISKMASKIEKGLRIIEKPQTQTNIQLTIEIEKHEVVREIKSKAAVMLIEAAQCLECKNFRKARQLYIDIGELCLQVSEPDQQITSWIQISCRFIALIFENERESLLNSSPKQENICTNFDQQINLNFNKISSQFTIENIEAHEIIPIDQDILQYISKINSILFGQNNILNNHSFFIMFASYWIPFVLVFIVLIASFLFLARQDFIQQIGGFGFDQYLPQIVLGGCCTIPIFMVFFKSQDQRTNQFFQQKLGECINVINQDCKSRQKNVEFILKNQGRKIQIKMSKKIDKLRQLQFMGDNETPDMLMNTKSYNNSGVYKEVVS